MRKFKQKDWKTTEIVKKKDGYSAVVSVDINVPKNKVLRQCLAELNGHNMEVEKEYYEETLQIPKETLVEILARYVK
jgi:hypothetical protein